MNISEAIQSSFVDKIDKANHYIPQRLRHLLAAPAYAIGAIGDLIINSGVVALNLATAGYFENVNLKACQMSDSGAQLLSEVYLTALRILNPEAKISKKESISSQGDGLIAEYTTKSLKNLAYEYSQGDYLETPELFQQPVEVSFIDRHIKSRALLTLGLIASPVIRLADLAIAAVAVPASVLTLGKFPLINNIAFRALETPALLCDLNYFGTHLINIDCPGI